MSQANVEISRRFFDAYNAGDMAALRELYDPDVVMHHVGDWPEPGPTVGREAVMRFIEQLRDTWDADTLEVTSEHIHAGDRVVVSFTWRGAGHGPQSNIELTTVSSIRQGKIREVEFFWDHDEALEAAALSESTNIRPFRKGNQRDQRNAAGYNDRQANPAERRNLSRTQQGRLPPVDRGLQ